MERLNGYVVKVHTTWLASSVNCCFPTRLQEQSVHEKRDFEDEFEKEDVTQSATASRRNSPLPISKYNTTTTVTTQPQPQSAPVFPAPHIIEEHPGFRESRRISKQGARTTWYGEDAELSQRRASRQSRRSTDVGRSMSRKRSLSRRKLKEPEEPKRVCVSPVPELPPFRPLHLSIHLPGNELPKLPKFSDDTDDKDDIPPVPEIPRPPQALMTAMPEPVLTRTVSRKTVATTKSSFENMRRSTDTEMTMVEVSWRPRTSSLSYSRMRSHSGASARSNQDFVEMLNNPLPTLPKQYLVNPKSNENLLPKQLLLKSKSKDDLKSTSDNDNEKPTLVRSASDQNKRLQTHLHEREQVDINSPDCSTIAEEKSPSMSPHRHSRRRSSSCPAPPRQISDTTTNVAPAGLGLIPMVPSAGILATSQLTQSTSRAPTPQPIVSATITDFTSNDPVLPPASPMHATTTKNFNDSNRQRSSSGSSTLLNPPTLTTATPEISSRPPTADPLSKPLITTTVVALNPLNPTSPTHNDKEKTSLNTVGARLTQWLTRSKSLSKESLRFSMLESQRGDSALSGRSWFDNRDSALITTTASTTLDEKSGAEFRVSALAKEIGLGELLDQKLGITHPPAPPAASAEQIPTLGGLEAKVEKSCGVVRSRSATESTFVGTERGASLDLKRLVTNEQANSGAAEVGVGMGQVGVAM